MNPHAVTREFEAALCEYTGAPYAVAVTSCTMALLLAVAWSLKQMPMTASEMLARQSDRMWKQLVEIPKRTYVGVGMSLLIAGARPAFRDEAWIGEYQLKPLSVWDCARWLRADMYKPHTMMCLSFHPAKHLGISTHGGAILLDDPSVDTWLRRARFDGRTEHVEPKNDNFDMPGFHCYMAPPTAAEGLERLSRLPRHNEPLPNSDYSDLSLAPIFQ